MSQIRFNIFSNPKIKWFKNKNQQTTKKNGFFKIFSTLKTDLESKEYENQTLIKELSNLENRQFKILTKKPKLNL